MHSALFVAKISGIDPMKWGDFLLQAKVGVQTFPNVSRLAENVWLVNFQESPVPLSLLVCAADAQGVLYGILPFEDVPEWLPVGFDPKTI
jgi:hypothetical protein